MARSWLRAIYPLKTSKGHENDINAAYYLIGLKSAHDITEAEDGHSRSTSQLKHSKFSLGKSGEIDHSLSNNGTGSSSSGVVPRYSISSDTSTGTAATRRRMSSVASSTSPGIKVPRRRASVIKDLIENTEVEEASIKSTDDEKYRKVTLEDGARLAQDFGFQFSEICHSDLDFPLSSFIMELLTSMPSRALFADHPECAPSFHVRLNAKTLSKKTVQIFSTQQQKKETPFFFVPTNGALSIPGLGSDASLFPGIHPAARRKSMFPGRHHMASMVLSTSTIMSNREKASDIQKAYAQAYAEVFARDVIATDVCDWL